ncbi:MAG: hypothetical protein JOZ15_12460, partial [Acidobacteria bacterium]|nr:hypothetical protein [Acidobacteriota bacterium]
MHQAIASVRSAGSLTGSPRGWRRLPALLAAAGPRALAAGACCLAAAGQLSGPCAASPLAMPSPIATAAASSPSPTSGPAAAPAPGSDALLAEVGAATLDPARAVNVQHVALAAGLATLRLDSGVVIPATPAGGRTIELAFVGSGHIELDPPDAVEAGQLELFTGHRRLEEDFTAMVLVLGMDEAAGALLRRPAATATEPQLAVARELFARWKKRERRVPELGVEGRILARAAGDPTLAGYFAALCTNARLGDFLYTFDPQAHEQVTLGRFVPLDAGEKESKKLLRELERAQRHGHLIGLEIEDLGRWDTWVSASPRDSKGEPVPGAAAFEPERYELDTDLADADLRLSGRARLTLRPVLKAASTVRLRLNGDLKVSRVTRMTSASPGGGPSGEESLYFHQRGSGVTVLLPRPVGAGGSLELTLEYSGPLIEKDWSRYRLLSTTDWYPHTGELDQARYVATFHWPGKLELVASGR